MKLVRFEYNDVTHSGELLGDFITYNDGKNSKLDVEARKVRMLAPVLPSKIVAVGLNYRDHAEELGMGLPEEPVLFLKPPSAVIGPGDTIICPRDSGRVDFEAELAFVIGKTAKNVSRDNWHDFVKGYMCLNDVTARDIQKKDGQWTRAKSFDTFAPMGPCIETNLDLEALAIRSYLNGELRQESSTSNFIFKIPFLLEFISRVMTLFPDDVITTGTPSKIGPMRPGDIVDIEIEGIGRLTNPVA